MVRQHLQRRGVTNRRILAAMGSVPREAFVPTAVRRRAYADGPLPIGNGQTISQPYMVALMTGETGITRKSRVLEIGTGSGYQTAVLARIALHVWTMERVSQLLAEAKDRLRKLGITNVSFMHGDGALGHPSCAPFDAIVVTAAAPFPPPPFAGTVVVRWSSRHSHRRSRGATSHDLSTHHSRLHRARSDAVPLRPPRFAASVRRIATAPVRAPREHG